MQQKRNFLLRGKLHTVLSGIPGLLLKGGAIIPGTITDGSSLSAKKKLNKKTSGCGDFMFPAGCFIFWGKGLLRQLIPGTAVFQFRQQGGGDAEFARSAAQRDIGGTGAVKIAAA